MPDMWGLFFSRYWPKYIKYARLWSPTYTNTAVHYNTTKIFINIYTNTHIHTDINTYTHADIFDPYHAHKWFIVKNDLYHSFFCFKIRTKSVKQCIQFYYIWKKVCTDEYRRLKQVRERRTNLHYRIVDSENDEKPYPDAKLLGVIKNVCYYEKLI